MDKLIFADDARETMERFMAVFPDATRDSYRRRLMRGIEYQALKKGVSQVTREMFIDALGETFPKSFDPMVMRFKDPKALAAMVAGQKEVDRAHPLVKVKRWEIAPVSIDRPVQKVLALMTSPRKKGTRRLVTSKPIRANTIP